MLSVFLETLLVYICIQRGQIQIAFGNLIKLYKYFFQHMLTKQRVGRTAVLHIQWIHEKTKMLDDVTAGDCDSIPYATLNNHVERKLEFL
jgi:hypothetical protein